MAFWDIFGGKAVEKGLDLIDDLYTSDEESADIIRKDRESAANAKIELMKAYAPFKLAQRYLAFSFAGTFLFILVNGVLGQLYGIIPIENVQAAREFADSMWLGEIVIMIMTFYFGGGLASSIKKGKN
jgi:hypothetical protein